MRRPRQRFGRPLGGSQQGFPPTILWCIAAKMHADRALPSPSRGGPIRRPRAFLPRGRPSAAQVHSQAIPAHSPQPRKGCGNRAGARPSHPQQGWLHVRLPSLDGLGLGRSPAPRAGRLASHGPPAACPAMGAAFFEVANGLAVADAGPGNGTGYHASDDRKREVWATATRAASWHGSPRRSTLKPERHLQPVRAG